MVCVGFWKCPAVVPWATTDGESGSIKTWIFCVGSSPLIDSVTKQMLCENLFKNEPLHVLKSSFIANEP